MAFSFPKVAPLSKQMPPLSVKSTGQYRALAFYFYKSPIFLYVLATNSEQK